MSRGFAVGLSYQIPDVGDVDRQEDRALPTVDRPAFEREGREEQQHRTQYDHQQVPDRDAAHRERMDRRAQAQDQQDVGDVRSDDVAQRHVGLALEQRHERRGQLGQRCAASHERDGDHRFADSEPPGDLRGAAEEHFAAENQSGEASDDHRGHEPSGHSGFRSGVRGRRLGPFRGADRVPHQRAVEQEHDDAVDASDAVRRTFEDIGVRCQRQQQQRYDHSERNVAADVARRERQGADQGADAQDDEDVEDVRPHDVADCHVAFACDGREHRHDQFGRRGTDGDHREPDDEFRHAEPLRQRRGAVRQEVRACEDQSEADDEE